MAGLQGGGGGGGGGGEEDPVRKRRKRQLCNNGNNNNNLLLLQDVASTSTTFRFNDFVTADIDLSLHLYNDDESTNMHDENAVHHLYLHSEVLLSGRSQYFSALLSDRWQRGGGGGGSSSSSRYFNLTYKVPSSSIDTHMIVMKLLYSTTDDDDDVNFSKTINTVSTALSILPVAIELLFEDCVKACIRLIEALPWTEEEEKRVLELIPLLKEEESQELLSRVKIDSSDDMLCRWILQLRFHEEQKDFIGKMLMEFPSKDSVRFALYHGFEISFKDLNELLVSPLVRSSNSFLVNNNGGYLYWLIERMIELRVADTALDSWINQEGCSLTKNIQQVCCSTDNRIPPVDLANVFACTCMLANAVATGPIVADRQVRIKLVKAWLPVVFCFKDMILRLMPEEVPELLTYKCEEPLFKILSTLPMSESQELLLQCIGFSNPNNVNCCCPHLELACKTWFRRAANQPSKSS